MTTLPNARILGGWLKVLRLAFFAPFACFIEDWLIPGVESDEFPSGKMSCSGDPIRQVTVNPIV